MQAKILYIRRWISMDFHVQFVYYGHVSISVTNQVSQLWIKLISVVCNERWQMRRSIEFDLDVLDYDSVKSPKWWLIVYWSRNSIWVIEPLNWRTFHHLISLVAIVVKYVEVSKDFTDPFRHVMCPFVRLSVLSSLVSHCSLF